MRSIGKAEKALELRVVKHGAALELVSRARTGGASSFDHDPSQLIKCCITPFPGIDRER